MAFVMEKMTTTMKTAVEMSFITKNFRNFATWYAVCATY